MPYDTTLAKLTGTPDSAGWSQVHIFKPENETQIKSKGQLFMVISVASDQEGLERTVVGRELLSKFHEEYFESKDKAFIALKKATLKINEDFGEKLGNIEIAALAQIENVVYLSCVGGPKVVIDRGGKVSKIIGSGKNIISASGYIKDKDIFVLGTSKFFESFDDFEIASALKTNDVDSAEEIFAPRIHANPDSGLYAVLFLNFSVRKMYPETGFNQTENTGKEAMISDNENRFPVDDMQDSTERYVSTKNPFANDRFIHDKQPESKRTVPVSARRSFLTRLQSRFHTIIPRILERKVYVGKGQEFNEPLNQRKRISISVGIILLLLLLVSIGFGVRQKKINDYKDSYKTKLDEAMHELNEAEAIYGLNPERSRELFTLSQKKVSELIGSNVKDPDLSNLIGRLEETRGKILGEYEAQPENYLDLTLLSNGFRADKLSLSGNHLFILDSTGKKIIQITLDTKTSKIVAGPGIINEAEDLAAYSGRVFVLNSDGIHEIKQKLTNVVEKDWVGKILIAVYGGNLYLLEKDASTIWRFSGLNEGFSTKKNWLASGINVDISDSVSFAIDGSIWILNDGRVLKFTMGSPQTFSVPGIYPGIENAVYLFTNEESKDLYLLDSDNSRVVIISKEGEYVAQYASDDIRNALGVVAVEKDKKMYLIFPDRISFIQLKHL